MKNISMLNHALQSALAYAGLTADEACCTFVNLENGLYEFVLLGIFMKYDFYVDVDSGEVLGFNSEPFMEEDTVSDYVACLLGEAA